MVASETEEQHLSDLEHVFSILATHNSRLFVDKCLFFQSSLLFLGYTISSEGVRPPEDRLSAITSTPPPETAKDLRRFMGMLNFFRHMVPRFAHIAHPVTELLRHNMSSKSLPWTEESRAAFDTLKQALNSCPTLSFPDPRTSQYQLVTDASSYAMGAARYQMIDGSPCPVGFFSRKFSDLQKTHSAYDRELLAAYNAVFHFRPFIDGNAVTLFTDHKPLVSAFISNSIAKSDRQQRQLSFLSEYVSKMEYI